MPCQPTGTFLEREARLCPANPPGLFLKNGADEPAGTVLKNGATKTMVFG
jgi:hypothetical protein